MLFTFREQKKQTIFKGKSNRTERLKFAPSPPVRSLCLFWFFILHSPYIRLRRGLMMNIYVSMEQFIFHQLTFAIYNRFTRWIVMHKNLWNFSRIFFLNFKLKKNYLLAIPFPFLFDTFNWSVYSEGPVSIPCRFFPSFSDFPCLTITWHCFASTGRFPI